jgi:hypothetical protein
MTFLYSILCKQSIHYMRWICIFFFINNNNYLNTIAHFPFHQHMILTLSLVNTYVYSAVMLSHEPRQRFPNFFSHGAFFLSSIFSWSPKQYLVLSFICLCSTKHIAHDMYLYRRKFKMRYCSFNIIFIYKIGLSGREITGMGMWII